MRTRAGPAMSLTLASLGLVAAYILLNEHWGHALGVLPYLLLLACPLLHLFSHGDHGGDHSRASRPTGRPGDTSTHPHGETT
jgi:hypothetical protein